MPVGFYDRREGRWKPSANGLVIRIIDIVSGKATIDGTRDGKADEEAVLAKLGVTEEELTQLAAVYRKGVELWRVPVKHFTPFDCNWPYVPPQGARSPGQPKPSADISDKENCSSGSVIGCEAQSLGEHFALTGTNASVVYSSDRQAGYESRNTVRIPLTDASPPASLQSIEIEVTVAGQKSVFQQTPESNKVLTFKWNGLDGYGRKVSGRQTARGRTGYVYPLQYGSPGTSETELAWAQVGFGAIAFTNVSQRTLTLWQDWEVEVGENRVDSAQLGGLTLSLHHQYDPQTQRVSLGGGGETLGQTSNTIETVAGTLVAGAEDPKVTDWFGKAATTISFPTLAAALPLPDGQILLAHGCSIVLIDKDGLVQPYAGQPDSVGKVTCGFFDERKSGDNGPKGDASLGRITALQRGQDGSIFVLENFWAPDFNIHTNSYIRRIGPENQAKRGLADAVAVAAGSRYLDELIDLAKDARNGSTRLFFADTLLRSNDPKARTAIESLQEDSQLQKHIKLTLRIERLKKRAKDKTSGI